MRYTTAGLIAVLAAMIMTIGAHAQTAPTPQERAAVENRIEAARSALRSLTSRNLEAAQQARTAPRIVNGEPEAAKGQWAWTVSVIADGGICGGAYVAPHVVAFDNGKFVQDWVQQSSQLRWVVTAAHCLFYTNGSRVPDDRIKVLGGTLRSDAATRAEHKVERSEVHERYDPQSSSYDNDIALLRISEPVNSIAGAGLTRVSIRLPADIDGRWLYQPYTALTVHGWGRKSENGFLSDYLQKVLVPLVEGPTCAEAYRTLGGKISPSMICAGYSSGGFDSCQGDSGGPISFVPAGSGVTNPSNDPILAGVVSWGYGCARQNVYGVYTNVLHMRPWLEQAVVAMQP